MKKDAARRRTTQESTRLRDLRWTLGAPQEPLRPEDNVTVHNVVATANFGTTIDLPVLAWRFYGVYNPKTFSAVHLRLREPSSTALIFSSGRIVCTGAKSEYAALCAISVYLSMVQQVEPRAHIVSQTIQNIVGVGKLSSAVKINDMAKSLVLRSAYDPEIFPGLRMKLRYPAMNVLVFCSGKVVLTGARNRNDLARAWASLAIISAEFLYRGDEGEAVPTHRAIAVARNNAKKRKCA